MVLHALGGAGKSALLRTFAKSCLRPAAAERAASMAGRPIARARASRNAPTPTASSPRRSAISAGRASCRTIRSSAGARWRSSFRRSALLLLLDGLEPLQDPPSVNRGPFKDKGLAELIRLLAG